MNILDHLGDAMLLSTKLAFLGISVISKSLFDILQVNIVNAITNIDEENLKQLEH